MKFLLEGWMIFHLFAAVTLKYFLNMSRQIIRISKQPSNVLFII